MLNKIGMFTFVVAFALTLLVSWRSPYVAVHLSRLQVPVEIWSLHINILYVIPALILAGIARIIRLHDKVSDIFGIRARFDLYRILIPLCGEVGNIVDMGLRNQLKAKRQTAMQRMFYEYASFEEPKISKALVLSAIDVWTWYWILLEATCLIILSSVVLVWVGAYGTSSALLALALLCVILFTTHSNVCGKKADEQIEEITSDGHRVAAIRDALSAIKLSA
jgi:hypothetical protein